MDTAPRLKANPVSAQRLAALRAAMVQQGLDGYLVPHGDEHQGEYVASYAERLTWLTGFSGSAGAAVVLVGAAAIFVDGRYTLQVRDQVDGSLYEFRHLVDEPPAGWIATHVKQGAKLGFDPRLHTPAGLVKIQEACAKAGATLVPVPVNLIDQVWPDRPPRPTAPVIVYPEKFAGRSSAEKRGMIATALKDEGVDAFLHSALDSIAWLFNIRGDDMECSPLTYAYALLFSDGKATLFIDAVKLSPEVRAHLGADVTIVPYDGIQGALAALDKSVAAIGIDRDTGSRWISDSIAAAGRKVKLIADPITAVKARKHPAELQGVREAHIRDGAALTRFLAWLSKEAPKGTLNEVTAADRLTAFRAESNTFRGPSFNTIAGAGANGAIVHYRANPKTAAKIHPDMVLLLDSGGQYLDGTTDVTRTVAVGGVTAEQKHRFTLVLKGHIALGAARFVKGTSGSQLDALARGPLWQEGLDYDHGTGHGVGTFLGVHEGPQRISKVANTVALEPGMVISNEPGYYKTGEYGIRIENLVAVREVQVAGAEKPLLEFETITLAPIDLNMVEPTLLTAGEKAWLNAYHTRVREILTPLVDTETAAWLKDATRAVV